MMHDESHANPSEMVIEGSVTALSPSHAPAPATGSGLTDLQEAFVRAFLENGGKAGPAAVEAGASHETYGVRLLAKRKVQDEIARRVKLQSGSALTIALNGLMKVIESPGSDDKAVVQAALGLMDRFGMAVQRGPLVAVQNNTTNFNGGQASAVLQQIAERAAARLARQDSGE